MKMSSSQGETTVFMPLHSCDFLSFPFFSLTVFLFLLLLASVWTFVLLVFTNQTLSQALFLEQSRAVKLLIRHFSAVISAQIYVTPKSFFLSQPPESRQNQWETIRL